jgi:hypothetical protein
MIRSIYVGLVERMLVFWRYIPEDGTLHSQSCENLRPYRTKYVSKSITMINIAHPEITNLCRHLEDEKSVQT